MKTTKKGFTLIELIVVIAIIGVLAAILVPTMLGYVKKSKLSSANTTASSVYKAINSALTELDEQGIDVGGLYLLKWDGSSWTYVDDAEVTDIEGAVDNIFTTKVSNFFADIDKVKCVEAQVVGGNCITLGCASDSTYTGTYPSGVITAENYDAEGFAPSKTEGKITLGSNVMDEALDKAGYVKTGEGENAKIEKKSATEEKK